ncbi:MAG TPA: hypothetical protein VE869_11395 [Gemmatimonas sp.]|nr:hypothetical protein [Gemmatimonas sp.]
MMAAAFVDPRVRMRDALRELVREDPAWNAGSLQLFRNRLLDHTGSDARPLAELLLEAYRRGWQHRIGGVPMASARWDALVAPFIMQWSAERFVQPDMARWAVECWGYALGIIDAGQLRIAPPPPPRPADGSTAALAAELIAKASRDHAGRSAATRPYPTSSGSRASGRAGTTAQNTRSRASGTPTVTATTAAGRSAAARAGAGVRSSARTAALPTRTPGSARATSRAGTGSSGPSVVQVWVTRVLMAGLLLMASGVVVSAALNGDTPRDSPDLPARSTAAASRGASPSAATAAADTVVPPSRPGVPSITTNAMAGTPLDRGAVMYVEPARRAAGNTRPMITAAPGVAVPLDEARMMDGSVMRGRVEVVRAGTVIFRDVTTGLRHELDKDALSEIITEFGTSVQFNGATRGTAPATDSRLSTSIPIGGTTPAVGRATRPRETGVRATGVAGRYVVTYAEARAVGSRQCTRVWQRAPNAVDQATVAHTAGADTATIKFEGGDSFPSNIDGEGRFASTFRIVPDQARTSTALTTRISGQFFPDGTVTMQVNIVYFQRMRVGSDVTCNVTVDARGTRETKRG